MNFAGFDLAVLVIVGLAAVGGLLRGFVHEVLSLGAWIAAIAAIYFFHAPLTEILVGFFKDNQTNAGLLAFVLLQGARRAIRCWGPSTACWGWVSAS